MVYRVYVEKRPGLTAEADALASDIRTLLGIASLERLRLLNRYDVENITPELFDYSVKTILSEPQLDLVTDTLPQEGIVFAVEYLPGQFDQRADSAAQCLSLIHIWSFMPTNQKERDRVAKMKQIPVHDLIEGKKLLFVDDSIVRGTQLRETVEFLYANGAKEVHIRSACPPIMYGCKFLNFSTSRSPMELLARRTVYELEGEEGDKHLEEYSDPNTDRGKKLRETICEKLHFTSLEYQSLDKLIEAIGLEPCKVCLLYTSRCV